MAECPECGEEIEDQFDTCWNCGAANPNYRPPDQFREEEEAEVEDDASPNDGDLSVEERLRQIQETQRQQQKMLSKIHSKVGCLFAYLVFSILGGIVYGIIVIVNAL